VPPEDAIPALAELYDQFAHALDPFSEEVDRAESVFMAQVSVWYDALPPPKPTLHEFRKGVIVRCKRHLSATDRPQDQRFLRDFDNPAE
jgi:hypothetical protein